jgi:hypothetical protein
LDIACFFKGNMMISQAGCHQRFLYGLMPSIFGRPDGAADFHDSFLLSSRQRADFTYGLNIID